MEEMNPILVGLEPLFKEAEEKGLYFYCTYQQLWFSPEKLREYHSKGQFIWGAVNWTLRDPNVKLNELSNQKKSIEREIEDFKKSLIK